MILICSIWGGQQVAIKLLESNITASMQIGLRSGVAALMVFLLLNKKDCILRRLADPRLLPAAMMTGGLFALEFFMVTAAITRTQTSHISLFLYTAPVITAVGLHFLIPEEKLNKYQWAGVSCSVAGTALALGIGSSNLDWSLSGDLFAIIAGLGWGVSTIIIRCTMLSTIPASCTLFYQLAIASIALCTYALICEPFNIVLDTTAVLNLSCQTIVVSFISYLVWFSLLRQYQAASLSSLILMTPVLGIFAGNLILGEVMTSRFITGASLLLLGLLFTVLCGKLQVKA